MPLQLNFRVEDRGGVMVLITRGRGDEELVRPATSAEVELWNALSKRFAAPARESYIRVNEQDLVTVLMERDHLRRQVTDLETKILELETDKNPQQVDAHDSRNEPHEAADDGSSPGGEREPGGTAQNSPGT